MEQTDWRAGHTMGFRRVSDVRDNPQKFGHVGGFFNGPRFLSREPFGHSVCIGA